MVDWRLQAEDLDTDGGRGASALPLAAPHHDVAVGRTPPGNLSELMHEAEAYCSSHFQHRALRAHQKQVLQAVFSGHDCLAVLPTGAGKSLCYGLPALMLPGAAVVVSPLIALMRDQVRRFQAQGISVAALDSLQSQDEKDQTWQRVADGRTKLLLVSPERLARQDVRERLAALPLSLVAVDEAHCISHWGSHFRPDYRFLGTYLEDLARLSGTRVPRLAMTATATMRVRAEIKNSLFLQRASEVWDDLWRENLKLRVVRTDRAAEQLSALLTVVMHAAGQGIVYCQTRKLAEDAARMLQNAGVQAMVYHAGLSAPGRQQAQQAFVEGRAQVMVATHAFGMGIDKQDLRFVHHLGLPGSLEQYVQEIGRAGRDGLPARCDLIYAPRDYHVQKFMIDKNFPEEADMRLAFAAVAARCDAQPLTGEQAGLDAIAEALLGERKAARTVLDLFCREGMVRAWRRGGETLLSIGDASVFQNFFATYAERKQRLMLRLEAMRAFANAAEKERWDLVTRYFNEAS